MSTWLWSLLSRVLVVAVLSFRRPSERRRSHILEEGFGPEYDRTVRSRREPGAAEAELRERQRRREELELRPLAPIARQGYQDAWQATQADFVDDPAAAIDEADRLIQSVMRDRGYPVEDFDDRAAIISVDHPVVVERYRRAHAVTVANAGGDATPRACGGDAGLPRAVRGARRGDTADDATPRQHRGGGTARPAARPARFPGAGGGGRCQELTTSPPKPAGRAPKAPSGVSEPFPPILNALIWPVLPPLT